MLKVPRAEWGLKAEAFNVGGCDRSAERLEYNCICGDSTGHKVLSELPSLIGASSITVFGFKQDGPGPHGLCFRVAGFIGYVYEMHLPWNPPQKSFLAVSGACKR